MIYNDAEPQGQENEEVSSNSARHYYDYIVARWGKCN